jgi:hypothetical protein
MVKAVTKMAITEEPTTLAVMGSHSVRMSGKCAATPAPAGTNSRGKCLSSPRAFD